SNLIDDSHRNVFGAVTQGGAFGFGEMFELIPPTSGGGLWAITDLADFGAAVAHAPIGPIVQGNGPKGSDGPLFGTLVGTQDLVYRLDP
ncbi:hypothetical protein, partial [Staphylococcus aureus]